MEKVPEVEGFETEFSKGWEPAPKHPRAKVLYELLDKWSIWIVIASGLIGGIIGYQFSDTASAVFGFMFVLLIFLLVSVIESNSVFLAKKVLEVDKDNLTSDEYAAKKMMQYFTERAAPLGGLADAVNYSSVSRTAILTEDSLSSVMRCGLDNSIIGGWSVINTSTQLLLNPETFYVDRKVVKEVVLILFGQEILARLDKDEGPECDDAEPELITCEGFYELLKDDSVRALITKLIDDSYVQLYDLYARPSVMSPKEFAKWIMDGRGRGEDFYAQVF